MNVGTALAGGLLAFIPGAASAVVTPFAGFQAVTGTVYNVSYANNADGSDTLYTTSSASYVPGSPAATSLGTPSSVAVNFNYLPSDPTLNQIGIIQANMTLSATTSGTGLNAPELSLGSGVISQGGFNGTISFTSVNTVTINGTTYAAGTNLLTGTFTNAALTTSYGGSSGSIFDSTSNELVVSQVKYTSQFLDFSQTMNDSFAFSLDAISPSARVNLVTDQLNPFSAIVGGNLSSDPAPVVSITATAVPEAATWVTMLAGFGLIGFGTRRRRPVVPIA